MLKLFQFECKKILKQRIYALLLVLFVGLLLYTLQDKMAYEFGNIIYHNADGTIMSKSDVQDEITRTKKKFRGEMDEAWWENITKEAKEKNYRLTAHYINVDKMNEVYGEGWYEDYTQNQEDYEVVFDEKNYTSKVVYHYEEPTPYYKEDIYDHIVGSISIYGSLMIEEQPWNEEDGTFGSGYSMYDDKPVEMPVYVSEVSKAEILLLKDYMNQQGDFYYDDSGDWFSYLYTCSNAGSLLMIWIIFVASGVINKERSQNTLELLSSTPYGRGKLFIAKTCAVFACGVMVMVVLLGSLAIATYIFGAGLGNPNVNISDGLNSTSIFTYGEGFLITLEALILGTFVTSVLGVACSTWLKSSYASLAIACLLVFIPNVVDIPSIDSTLFPMGFMETTSVGVMNFTIDLFGQAFFLWKLLPILWIPICILISIVCYRKYKSKMYAKV